MRRISEEKRAESRARRAELKVLSQRIKILVSTGAVDSINEGLKLVYARDGHTDLRTFKEWKEAGYSINEGVKSCMVWSKPWASKHSIATARATANEDAADEDLDAVLDTFGVCHLYGADQVHPSTPRA